MLLLRAAAWLVLPVLVLLAGCSDSDGGGTGPSSTISAPAAPATQSVTLGSVLSFIVTAPAGSTLSVAPLPLPMGMMFDLATGELTFNPIPGQVGQPIELIFTASADGQSASTTTTIDVLAAPAGSPTQLSGEVRGSESQQPLSNVALRIPLPGGGEITGATDSQGRFLFADLPDGAAVLEVDGGTATQGNYTFVAENLELVLGHMVYPEQLNVIDRPIYLPLLGASAGTITNGGGTLVSAAVPEVQVQVSNGSAKNADGSTFSGDMFIPEVAAEFTPAALPDTLNPALVVAIQPAGLTFNPPAQVTFPNLDGLEPGSEVDIWSIDAGTGLFEVAGTGRVSTDGALIETISGGIQASSWHFPLPGPPNIDADDAIEKDGLQDPNQAGQCPANSAVEAAAGALMVDHRTPSYWSAGAERYVRLNYHSDRAAPRPIINTDISTPNATATPNAHGSRLEIGGLAQPFEVFTEADVDATRVGVFFDATTFETGIYPFCYGVTNYYDASTVGSEVVGSLLVHSEANSPFGCGWMIDGIQRLYPVTGTNEVVITGGDSSATVFTPQQPLGSGEVRIELAFALDASGSVSFSEFAFQLQGIAAAVADPTIVPPDGSVAIAVLQFANQAQVEIPLTIIDSEATAQSVATQIENINKIGGGTNITDALNDAAELLLPGTSTARQSICLTTDGQPSSVANSLAAAQAAIDGGLEQIDSIGIGSGPQLDYLQQVSINGSVTIATDFQQVASAVAEKLRLVIGGAPSGEFSFVLENGDGTFTRVFKDGTRAEFDAAGLQTALLDRNGNRTEYRYDGQGRPIELIDPVGRSTVMRYSGAKLAEIEDPAGRVTRLTHNALGQLVRIEDPDGEAREFAYDSFGCLIQETDRRGGVVEYRFNALGRIDSVLLQDGAERSYTAGDLAALVADPTTTSVDAPSPKVTQADVTSTYTDANGNTSTFLTDGFGRFTREEDALGRVTLIERNADGLPTLITRPNGAKTAITYDLRGNPLTVTEQGTTSSTSDDRTWIFSYEPQFNQLRSIVDPKGNVDATTGVTTLIEYDSNGNPERITDALGTVTEMRYDETGLGAVNLSGLLTSITEAMGRPEERTTRYRYTVDGLLAELVDPLGRTSSWTYDAQGRVTGTTAEGDLGVAFDDQTTGYAYDALNRISSITDALGGITSLSYDAEGNLRTVADAKSPAGVTQFTYDERGRLQTRTDPLNRSESYSYDEAGNLARFVDRKGQVFSWTYDDLDRPLTKEFPGEPGESGNEFVSYGYDNDGDGDPADDNGNLARITDSDSDLRFTWNGFDELDTASTFGSPLQPSVLIDYDYDRNGNRVRARATSGGTVSDISYAYDALDRLDSLSQAVGNLSTIFAYDPLSQRQTLTRSFGGGVVETSYDYTPAGDLELVEHWYDPAGARTLLSSFGYTYDALGNRTQLTQERPALGLLPTTSDYDYDPLNRLLSASQPGAADESYSYDPVGNRLTASGAAGPWQYNAANQVLDDGTYTYSYDANGNRISRTAKGDPSDIVLYDYDPENRLARVFLSDGTVARNRYDGLGRRIEQSLEDGSGTTINRRVYVYDDEDILFEDREASTSSTTRITYTHGGGIDEALFASDELDTRALLADGLGSLSEEVDAIGTTQFSRRYETFGQTIQESGVATSSYGFTGREADLATGLFFYRARHLDPNTGAFLQEDPLRLASGSPNLFAYAENSPVMLVDPSGEFINVLVGAAVGAGFNIGAQLIASGGDFSAVDVSSVAASAALGAVGFGVASKLSQISKAAQGVDDLLAAAGGILKGKNVVADGGRSLAKDLFRQFAKGPFKKGKDVSGGGRFVEGKLADGTTVRIRFKPDGSTRIQAGKQKIVFPK